MKVCELILTRGPHHRGTVPFTGVGCRPEGIVLQELLMLKAQIYNQMGFQSRAGSKGRVKSSKKQ